MTEQEIFEQMKWFIAQNKMIQMEIWKRFGAKNQKEAEELRKKLVKAIKEVKTLLQKDRRKFLDRDLGQLAETTRLRILAVKQKPRKRAKRGTLKKKVKLQLQHIDHLRSQGLGWRKVAEYLQRYARLQISHNQLRLLYQKLKEEKQEQQRPDDQTKGREIIPTSDPKVVIRKKLN